MQRIITLYLQTAAELIKELEAASVSNQAAILYRASHTLNRAARRSVHCHLRLFARHWRVPPGAAPFPTRKPALRRLQTSTSASKERCQAPLYRNINR